MKPLFSGPERAIYVQKVFIRVAEHYDCMNRLMTGGQDVPWRREAIRRTRIGANERLLDLGTGTGDLAREALRQQSSVRVSAADFTLKMMTVGQQRGELPFLAADALRLPFKEAAFDAVVSGFLMRNVSDLAGALAEQYRVLRAGGKIVILETTRPQRNLWSPLVWLHMHLGIPLLGGLVSGFREGYQYLPDSSEQFLRAEELAEKMAQAGFREVGFQRRMAGTIAIHWGIKPLS